MEYKDGLGPIQSDGFLLLKVMPSMRIFMFGQKNEGRPLASIYEKRSRQQQNDSRFDIAILITSTSIKGESRETSQLKADIDELDTHPFVFLVYLNSLNNQAVLSTSQPTI